ncbi:MAG: prohead protease/major capsid protein fusion protein [Hyphomonas sp.]
MRLTGNPDKASGVRAVPSTRPADQTQGEKHTRAALFYPATFNEEGQTVEAVASTFADVLRRDSKGAYLERLDQAGLNTDDLVGAPLLDAHQQGGAQDVIGVITSHRFEGNKLIVTLRLSQAEDAAPAIQRIREGTLRGVSIGYRVTKWREAVENIAGRNTRVRTAAAWSIHEASAVAVPADPQSRFRSADEMPKDTQQTDDREALIARVRAAHNLGDDWQTRMAEAGEELSDDEIREDAREAALTARRSRETPRIRVGASSEDPAAIRERQTEALACRMMGTTPSDAARPYAQMGLQDFARDALTRSGVSVATMGREEMLTRAATHTTSDFPELLTGAGNRVLANAYQAAQSPLKQLARQRTAADFRPMSILKLGEMSGLQKVTEAGEIKAMTTGEAQEGYSLETFGGIFSLSRKAIINDDLGAFSRWGELMGSAAAQTEATQLLALLTANSGGGVKMADGVNLFHATHGNLAATGDTISEETLSEARLALRSQKGLDGKTPVSVTPRFLLVGPALETTAEKLLAAINPSNSDDVNPFAGKLTLLVEPRLTGFQWFLFGDPTTSPVLEYAYLSSAPGPQLSSRDGWEVLGREFRVTLDFGAGATDWRGAYRNAG